MTEELTIKPTATTLEQLEKRRSDCLSLPPCKGNYKYLISWEEMLKKQQKCLEKSSGGSSTSQTTSNTKMVAGTSTGLIDLTQNPMTSFGVLNLTTRIGPYRVSSLTSSPGTLTTSPLINPNTNFPVSGALPFAINLFVEQEPITQLILTTSATNFDYTLFYV
ncbi:MAG: hypothetical protein RLZ12_215 [Bacillota bacterium]|jgi:hypothetical protein